MTEAASRRRARTIARSSGAGLRASADQVPRRAAGGRECSACSRVHIQLFAFPSLARWNPTAYGDFTGVNWWAWLVTAVLADGKFIAIFAMLLGVSIVMLASEADDRAVPAWRVHMRRMAVLLILGLLHAYLSGAATCSFPSP